MKTLDQKLVDEIHALSNKAYLEESMDDSIRMLTEAWNMIPDEKEYPVADNVSRLFVQVYFHSGNFAKANEWIETYLKMDGMFGSFAEGSYYAGRIAFEMGEFDKAIEHLVIAIEKGGKRRLMNLDQKYKDFYLNHELLESKIAAYKEANKPKKVVSNENLAVNSATRKLFNDTENKVHFLLREGLIVKEESGKTGKTKTASKTFPDEMSAKAYITKKEYELLKKGFVYRNENAKPGESTLHYFLSRGYTGALGFASSPHGIYVSRVGMTDTRQDFVDVIDTNGIHQSTITLPRTLPWQIQYNDHTDLLYFYLDKCMYEYNPETERMTTLTDPNPREFSNKNLAFGHDVLVFNTKDEIKVTLNAKAAAAGKFEINIPIGHEKLAFTLSKDGKILVLFNRPGALEWIDISNGKPIGEMEVDVNYISQMQLLGDNKTLVLIDQDQRWNLRFFDLEARKEITFPEIEAPAHSYAHYFSMSADETKLAVAYGYRVFVYDFNVKKQLHDFQFEHIVKKSNITFVGDLLGARTDSGFLSLYKV